MYVVPIRWCPPTNSNIDFDSSSPQTNSSDVDAREIPVVGKTCHQCRQKTRDVAATCKNPRNGKPCVIRFCHKCLLNRYGEIVKEVNLLTNWMCPKCRGICNCSSCMKKRGQQPTGALAHIAKASGFKSVSEMLIKNASEDLKSNNVNNVDAVPSKEAYFEKEVVLDPSEKTRKENSLGDMTRSQMDGPKAWGANDFFFDPASLASNGC
ncbi:uncharacterized protein LOC131647389 [Vicia villosa]|uniref:uncharacterized protein LOC131647389 n=1 Tax=Vicia villosa TaxID=3911 RepID=UPI00273B427A|nr:uncharacterized protein LOC131647389 [Vicia villosa]